MLHLKVLFTISIYRLVYTGDAIENSPQKNPAQNIFAENAVLSKLTLASSNLNETDRRT